MTNENRKDWIFRFRDLASLVAFLGPIVMVAGLIGTWSVLQYRLTQVERQLIQLQQSIQGSRESQIRDHDEQLRGAEKFQYMDKELRRCCDRR